MAEVVAETGILWARRVALQQFDEKGWTSYLPTYGIENQEALEQYLKSDARKHFWKEVQAFEEVHYSERFYGEIDFTTDA